MPRLTLILDIDLDYFVEPVVRGSVSRLDRPDSNDHLVRKEPGVRTFLESKCRLSLEKPVPGIACEHHEEVYHHLDRLISSERLRPPFIFVHVDAHHDMMGDPSGTEVHSANFLLRCVCRDWIDYLIMVLPPSERSFPVGKLFPCEKGPGFRTAYGTHEVEILMGKEEDGIFELPISPDFCFVTRSPNFSPASADPVFELLKEYIQIER